MSENEKKKGKKKEAEKVSPIKFIVGKFNDYKGEFKKIIWPDRKELTKHTVNVILTSLIVGAVIVAMDLVFTNGYNLIIRYLG